MINDLHLKHKQFDRQDELIKKQQYFHFIINETCLSCMNNLLISTWSAIEVWTVYLGFVACTGHPALEKTEGSNDFVLL